MYDLDIVIPALREEFLVNTIENILKNKRGKTGVIAVLDGEWTEPPIPDHPDVRIVYTAKNLGQRGATNLGVKLSTAKYVAKTDAHVAFDEGFDVKLMEAMAGHDDWTIAPAMKNLHAFSWVCDNCQTEWYQGEKPDKCNDEMCQFIDTNLTKKIYFVPRGEMGSTKSRGPTSTAYRFTPDNLQFKYFGALKEYQEAEGEVAESMSLQGSFFMLTREKYWELNICDESWGGWGQQGTEVALKTWLSGGRVVIHRGTWYAHMFRTNDQVAFPWNKNLKESQGSQQRRARKASIELFKNNAWDKQVRGLSWVVERFWEPLQKEASNTDGADRQWTRADIEELKKTEGRFREANAARVIEEMGRTLSLEDKGKFLGKAYVVGEKAYNRPTKGIIYYTDSRLEDKIAPKVRDHLQRLADKHNLPIVSSSLQPLNFGKNIHINADRGYLTMFKQILACLEESTADIIYFCEHDVLYHSSHFDFAPQKGKFYYNQNWWKIGDGDRAVHWDADQVSGLCGYREELIAFYRERIASFDPSNFDRKFEPMSGEGSESWKSEYPNIDIRHNKTLTLNKWSLADFRDKTTAKNFEEITLDQIPGWKPKNFSDIV